MSFYKTLSKNFADSSNIVDTSKINYSLSIPKLSEAQSDLLEKVFKFKPKDPVQEVLEEYNKWVNQSWDLLKERANNPQELQLFNFPWELVYEIVRKDFFPHRQKRSESYFVFNELSDAMEWAKRRHDYVICEVNIDYLESSFTGDMNYLDCVEIDSSFYEIVESVKKYWDGQISENPKIETLLKGNIVLTRI